MAAAKKKSTNTASKAGAKAGGAASATSVIAQLKSLGDAKVRAMHQKNGADGNCFGVKMGDIRKVAAKIKKDHALANELWATGNLDARLVAILVLDAKQLSAKELDAMVRTARFGWLADWLNSYVVKEFAGRESLRLIWLRDKDPWAARSGWALTSGRVARTPEGLDIPALMDRIEREMGKADTATQWTMNSCLATIGIHHAKHRKRALAIGEKLGVYRDWAVSKGCTSPFAPEWINEMVKRQG